MLSVHPLTFPCQIVVRKVELSKTAFLPWKGHLSMEKTCPWIIFVQKSESSNHGTYPPLEKIFGRHSSMERCPFHGKDLSMDNPINQPLAILQ